jgi:hypothetical protein
MTHVKTDQYSCVFSRNMITGRAKVVMSLFNTEYSTRAEIENNIFSLFNDVASTGMILVIITCVKNDYTCYYISQVCDHNCMRSAVKNLTT